MKHLITGLCGAGLLVAVTGCQPELAQVKEGQREAQWREAIGQSYSGFRPPRTAPPAIKDNVSPKLVEKEQQAAATLPAADGFSAPAPQEDDFVVQNIEVEAVAVDVAVPPGPAEDAGSVAVEPAAAAVKAPEAVVDQTAGEATEYVVKKGDKLSHIAQKFYGKASFADVIRKANAKAIANPNRLKPGTKLQIPKL